jgi:hypothetical protein
MPFHHFNFNKGVPHRTRNINPHTLTSTFKKISEQFARYLDEISERSIKDGQQIKSIV